MRKEKTIYALGFFDGVHLGHQALLTACRQLAETAGCKAGVVTFSDHPDTLVLGATPKLINTAQDRENLLKKFKIAEIVTLPFDKAMMQMPWQDFFRLLVEDYGAAGLICGHDFRFGNKGEGNPELLQKACQEEKMPCQVIPEQKLEGVSVSSTYIRTLLEQGKMGKAVRFLGHPYILTGKVVSGQKLGRTMGIPTANLLLPQTLVQPKFGVYTCKVRLEEVCYLAVTNVGKRPTVGGGDISVEAFLLDFNGDLYGKELILEFYEFLRPEKKFENLQALQTQIRIDAEKTRNFFEKK